MTQPDLTCTHTRLPVKSFLHKMGLVHLKETAPVLEQWKVLDADGSGFLDENDLLLPSESKHAELGRRTPSSQTPRRGSMIPPS